MIALALLLSTLSTPPAGDSTGFGKSLALVGDLDGDRACEVAVGSPSDGEKKCGKIFVFGGKDGSLLRALDGPAPGSGYGSAVDAIGDLDGDGVPDLAVGAPYAPAGERRDAGRVDLLSGKDGKLLRTLQADPSERYLGTDLVSIGDVDGDGKEDLLVRARAGAGREELELFTVFSGASGARLHTVESPPGVTSHDLGRPLARLPDVDGDKVSDFAVEYGSEIHVHSGKEGKELTVFSSSLPSDAKSSFGFAMCGVPGTPVFVVAGDTREEVHGSVRAIPVVLGHGDEARRQAEEASYILGDEELAGVGCSLAFAGDLDGDKVPDLVAGVCDGRRGGLMVLSSKGLSASRTLQEKKPAEGRLPMGWRVAAGQDVDGDGTSDIAASRYWPTALDAAVRGVVIFSGRDGRRIRELSTPSAETGAK